MVGEALVLPRVKVTNPSSLQKIGQAGKEVEECPPPSTTVLGWVYDVTLFCEASPPPTLTSVLLGRAAKAHMYIRRFKLEEIPKSEAGSAAWLQDLFVTKDALLESFHSKGSFDGVEGCPVHPPVVLPPRHFSLLVAVGVNLAVLYPLCKVLLSSGPWGLAFTAVGFAAASAGIKYFLGLTQVGSFDLA